MAVHKLTIGAFEEIDYKLFAIHTSIEDYFLAYLINKSTPLLLSKVRRNASDTEENDPEPPFSRYIFENHDSDVIYSLIQNKAQVDSFSQTNTNDLFQSDTQAMSSTVYLLPEYKKVDYFIKVENDDDSAIQLFESLQKIDQIEAVYEVNMKQIKTKNNLLF